MPKKDNNRRKLTRKDVVYRVVLFAIKFKNVEDFED